MCVVNNGFDRNRKRYPESGQHGHVCPFHSVLWYNIIRSTMVKTCYDFSELSSCIQRFAIDSQKRGRETVPWLPARYRNGDG